MGGCGGEEQEAAPTATPTATETVVQETPTLVVVTETPVATPEATPSPIPTEGEPPTSTPTVEENVQRLLAALTEQCDEGPCYRDPADPYQDFRVYWTGEIFVIELHKWLDSRDTAAEAVRFMKEAGIEDHCNPVLPIHWGAPGTEGVPFCPEP